MQNRILNSIFLFKYDWRNIIISKEVNNIGINIDTIEYIKEGSNNFLRIIIDRDKPINIDECVEVTNIINPLLDDANIIEESYILDVSTKEKGE